MDFFAAEQANTFIGAVGRLESAAIISFAFFHDQPSGKTTDDNGRSLYFHGIFAESLIPFFLLQSLRKFDNEAFALKFKSYVFKQVILYIPDSKYFNTL
ncbi:hypothetical protein EfmAA290_18350 [Enterococcus faecium]|nr:hypothetical protein EfmAA290_18350 [Enterococcus faecium]